MDIQHFPPIRRITIEISIPFLQRLFQRSFSRNLGKIYILKLSIMLSTHQVGKASDNCLATIHHKNSTELSVMEIHHICMKDIQKRVLNLEARNPSTLSSSAAN